MYFKDREKIIHIGPISRSSLIRSHTLDSLKQINRIVYFVMEIETMITEFIRPTLCRLRSSENIHLASILVIHQPEMKPGRQAVNG